MGQGPTGAIKQSTTLIILIGSTLFFVLFVLLQIKTSTNAENANRAIKKNCGLGGEPCVTMLTFTESHGVIFDLQIGQESCIILSIRVQSQRWHS